jgi:hypothetical protein
MKVPHLLCRPELDLREGAEHSGLDAYLRCRCGRETLAHLECDGEPTIKAQAALRREWLFGKTRRPEQGAPQ